MLTGTAVPFGYIVKETELRASQPLIQLSPRGRIRGVRFNNRSARPERQLSLRLVLLRALARS